MTEPNVKAVFAQSRMKKDVKLAKKRGFDMTKLATVIDLLKSGAILDAQYKDHTLVGDWVGYRDCHLAPDWILIYKVEDNTVILARTGTHSDLFR